ncbi:hypothetical protein [Herbiconiux sp.]|uniref:hypothetical protein n=1 Tax=Herbiconiux sp. TaxID=1871186 RepID=UPI0025BD4441|nr:hypothetical protein [Herbiconiux sp.]
MKHITYSDKSLLVGDAAADAIVEYAALLARHGSADTVTLNAYGADGGDVEATFVLDTGTVLMAETTESSIPEPDNSRAVQEMQEKTRQLECPASVRPDADADAGGDGGDPAALRYFDEL